MSFISYQIDDQASFGWSQDEKLYPVLAGGRALHSLKEYLLMDLELDRPPRIDSQAAIDLDEISYLPPIAQATRIFCVGKNYHDHRKEMGGRIEKFPTIFTRFSSSLVGHQQALHKPTQSDRMDYEGELAIVIGKAGKNIAVEQALRFVAGYSCFNDVSIRDWQRHTSQFTPGKNFDSSGAFGPALVLPCEIEDQAIMFLETRLNNEVMQSATPDLMIFSIAEIIAYLSTFCRLRPGDVIATGTPGGVGDKRKPARYLTVDDVIAVEISPIGCLSNTVIAAP